MNIVIGLRIYVKFRMLGITFGTFDRSLSASIGPNQGLSFSVLAGPPANGVTTLVNERGVLLQAWA
ncbi:MAG TPA: hypothetical protein VKT78_14480 [Fimbriimonadaceae bacterium]|nr:hypothetical protein [Fimbriimonadaceae bacterium]